MNKISLKKISSILIISFLLLLFIGCNDVSDGNINDSSDKNVIKENTKGEYVDLLDARVSVSDELPNMDFAGMSFRIIYQERFATDAYAEEMSGEVLNDAVYERNQKVSERFNIKIVPTVNSEQAMATHIINTVNAGDDEYDLYMGHAMYSGEAALSGLFIDWYSIDYIDFTNPWFPKYAIEGLTLNGRMYMTVADMCLSLLSNVYAVFFDKTGVESYGIPDVYTIVNDGQWTLDKLSSLTKDIYIDLNANDQADEYDFYGFVTEKSNSIPTYIFSCDQPVVKFYDDQTIELLFESEKTDTIITKLRNLLYNNTGSFTHSNIAKVQEMFNNQQVLFLNSVLNSSVAQFRAREADYGIIPYPKFDEIQENYYTNAGGAVSALAVPKTARNLDMIGIVTAALCAESWKHVLPVYYDVVLKVKGARDEVSVEMLDTIFNGRVINISFIYDSWKGYNYSLPTLVNSNQELASFCAANDSKVLQHYQRITDLFFSEE